MGWLKNRRARSLADLAHREIETMNLLYAGRYDDAADELDDISAGYARLGDYLGAARALARRVDPLVNAMRMGEVGADSFRLGEYISHIPSRDRPAFEEFREIASGSRDSGVPLAARTVSEALVYLELSQSPEIDHAQSTSATREGDTYVLRHHAIAAPVRFLIPVQDVPPASFGTGRSKLIDAGQWIDLATEWTRQAEQVATSDIDAASDLLAQVNDAYGQALAFVPPGRDRVGDDGVWTEHGRQIRAARPEAFYHDWLVAQLAATR